MSKIFGKEHFIDQEMVKIISNEINHKIDELVLDKMEQTIHYVLPEIEVDKDKIRDWVVFCIKLESIDKSDLIDLATKNKFADKDHRIAVLEEAMKCLADSQTDSLHQIAVLEKALWNTITIGHLKRYYKKRFYRAIEQAEKELKEEE